MKERAGFLFVFLVLATANLVFAYDFCDDGIAGSDDLRIISVDDMLLQNSQEWIWASSDKVELEVRVQNREEEGGDYVVEIVFVDKDGDEVEIVEDEDDLIEDVSLSSGERKSAVFQFELENDVDEEDYTMYVKFYKEDFLNYFSIKYYYF